MPNKRVSARITIEGVVQGVGFRPFIYNLAVSKGIKGFVLNSSVGVVIEAEGALLDDFIDAVTNNPPSLSKITAVKVEDSLEPIVIEGFEIRTSIEEKGVTLLLPDIATCPDCLEDIRRPDDRRFGYVFTNCTNCGPRYSITQDIPYDRAKTTMSAFAMCPDCKAEYNDPKNRRFHAQPNACPVCGPRLSLIVKGKGVQKTIDPVLETIELLKKGYIVAIKGLGGFQIACNASDGHSVKQLRMLKRRGNKPFALMARDVDTVRSFAIVDDAEAELLSSYQSPIVLLKKMPNDLIAKDVSPENDRVGVMLPYTPLHYRLFETGEFSALVMTSGNRFEEPIIADNNESLDKLNTIADAFLIHDRDIFMRVDDSICEVFEGVPRLIRRARGYVPAAIEIPFSCPDIIAVGAELKSSFTITKGRYAIMSQHLGDAESLDTMEFFDETLKNLSSLYRLNPRAIACDMHPDYLTSGWAKKFSKLDGLGLHQIQHHHAHIASCMVDNGLDEKVIGVAMDGLGFGTDKRIWGGEFMICDYIDFVRAGHFKYAPMPGGDKAAKEPWRMAVSYLIAAFPDNYMDIMKSIGLEERIGAKKIKTVLSMIEKKINTPYTSSAGRLFDAVASISGVMDEITFEAESAIALEAVADDLECQPYKFSVHHFGNIEVDFSETIREIVSDVLAGAPKGIVSARFHETVAESLLSAVYIISKETSIKKAVLSGGVFQNRRLRTKTLDRLRALGMETFTHSIVPTNDGGISLGQAVIAGGRMRRGR